MVQAIHFIETYEFWLYALCAVGALLYLRAYARATHELSRTIFGLEREAARGRQLQAVSMMGVMLIIAGAIFVIVTFIGPSLPSAGTVAGTPASAPGVNVTVQATAGLLAGTPLPIPPLPTPLPVDGSGCVNPQATLTSPVPAEVLSGVVEVKGTANIPSFGFYKFEVSGPATGGNWNTISAGSSPVEDGVLGSWDTRLFTPGSYALRLVVFDAAGESPAPCVVPIIIAAPP